MRFFPAILSLLLPAAALAADCSRTTTSRYPLTEPFIVRYQGSPVGLYSAPDPFGSGGGTNVRPAAHDAAGRQAAAKVIPRNSRGEADPNGSIVLLSLGMSNTTAEFQAFQQLAAADSTINPKLVLVDGAIGSWSADRIVASPAEYWSQVEQRLAAAGVTAAQVQAAWLKNADAAPALSFPNDAAKLQGELSTIVQSLPAKFPNLAVLYLSSRIYAGYATTNLNPEPYAFQSGFAVRGLIDRQISGAAELSYTAGAAPWMSWGPYLWADGTRVREDGLTWQCADFEDDGTHPSASGRAKVATMLLDFFHADPTANVWFDAPRVSPQPVPSVRTVVNAASMAPGFANGSVVTLFGNDLASGTAVASTLPLPHTLAGTQVLVGGLAVPLYFVSPTQINFLYPISPEGVEIKVVSAGAASSGVTVNWQVWAPGIFAGAENRAAAEHVDGSLVTPQAPARRGEVIAIWVTGLGVRNPISSRPDPIPQIRLDGQSVGTYEWAGPAPGLPGLTQINFRIPADAPTGSSVKLTFALLTEVSNETLIAIQ